MTNMLLNETSPYLLQHAHNPVDWHPWGPEALESARRSGKPILVSIGYSACHWCHVMAHESFEDVDTARLMNEHFINIKVDREERPDVDAIYMEAVQALSGQGGWPLNVFLTPDGKPFYGGTYFPPVPRHGMPSWTQLLRNVVTAFEHRRGDVTSTAEKLTKAIQEAQRVEQSPGLLTEEQLQVGLRGIAGQMDLGQGGFGGAPKFPQPMSLEFLLRMFARYHDSRLRDFVELTLHRMADGGIFDQLGGGFHRYTVEGAWIVPHFEKMLYDNALLVQLYVKAYQLTRNEYYRRVVEQTVDYLLREMRSPKGGFYSAEDADSEGEEGKYYVWTPEQITQVLDEETARIVSLRFGISPAGNFEGRTILTASCGPTVIAEQLNSPASEVEECLEKAKRSLLAVRSQRVPPGKDTKILAGWNALAIRALAEAGRVLGRDEYLRAARCAMKFVLDDMRPSGRLIRSYKDGPGQVLAFLEDYSYLLEALITLYETSHEIDYLDTARDTAQEMVRFFWDDAIGGFFDTASDSPELVVRPRGFFDNPIPSGNSAATMALLRLEALTGEEHYRSRALPALRTTRDLFARAPLAFSYMLCALDFYLSVPLQIAVAGHPGEEGAELLVNAIYERYIPNKVVAMGSQDVMPLLRGRACIDGRATAYVCEHFACQLPVTEPNLLREQLDKITASRE
jgi:uncharacterized protein